MATTAAMKAAYVANNPVSLILRTAGSSKKPPAEFGIGISLEKLYAIITTIATTASPSKEPSAAFGFWIKPITGIKIAIKTASPRNRYPQFSIKSTSTAPTKNRITDNAAAIRRMNFINPKCFIILAF